MSYKIKHESLIFPIIMMGVMLLLLGTTVFDIGLSTWGLKIFFGIMIILPFLHLITNMVGVTVIFEDSYMVIKSLWSKKEIAYDPITDVTTKRYKRRRRYRYDIRMKMTINLANGKKIVLNDNAGEFRGVSSFMRSTPYDKPDEEVPLYQVCQMIRSKIGDNSYYYE